MSIYFSFYITFYLHLHYNLHYITFYIMKYIHAYMHTHAHIIHIYVHIYICTYICQILRILRSMYFNVILDAQKFFDINEIDRDLQRYFMYIHIKSTTKSRIMGSHDREALKRYGCRCC